VPISNRIASGSLHFLPLDGNCATERLFVRIVRPREYGSQYKYEKARSGMGAFLFGIFKDRKPGAEGTLCCWSMLEIVHCLSYTEVV
jgi:hypothetical protein